MNRRHLNSGIVLVAVVGSLLEDGCSSPAPSRPNTRPTAFFEWCAGEKFGVKSPEAASIRKGGKNVSSGEIGVAEHRAWTPCKNEDEARLFLDATAAELRRVAEEKGITLQSDDDLPDPQVSGFLLRYQSGRNH